MRELLEKRIRKGVLFVDGAMGTQLFERGVEPGGCNEKLNVDRPEVIQAVHEAYFNAGCDAVLTNSFGGSAISLRRHKLSGQAHELNLAAAKIARKAAGDDHYVLGDIGPVGDFLEPLGTLKEADLLTVFAEQAKALDEGGVDGFIVETMAALEEISVAVKAIRSVSSKPILASMAFDPAPEVARTMMGVSPQMLIDKMKPLGVCAVGFNCGTLDMHGYIALAEAFAEALKGTGMLLLAEPNAGFPHLHEGKAVYTLSSQAYAEAMIKIHDVGAKIMGGCCGTNPNLIAEMIKAVKQ